MIVISSKLGMVIRFEGIQELSAVTNKLIAYRNAVKQEMRISPFYDLVIADDKLVGAQKRAAVEKFSRATGAITIKEIHEEPKKS
jgi:hypothetical protein